VTDKRQDDRDSKKSAEEATEDPWEAQKDASGEQPAELQVAPEDERKDPSRFEPDPKAAKEYSGSTKAEEVPESTTEGRGDEP
jgi:hypothetical protein